VSLVNMFLLYKKVGDKPSPHQDGYDGQRRALFHLMHRKHQ